MARSLLLGASLVSLAAWSALVLFRGGFWRVRLDEHVATDEATVPPGIRVEAVVPARDEAETIATSVASLIEQDFPGQLNVTLVDDASSDGTARLAGEAAAGRALGHRFRAVSGRPLAKGWTGKLGALDAGVARVLSERPAPTYWLFADADIDHDPRNVAALVAKAERDRLDLVSLMVRLRCRSGWERLLVPAFVFFFRKLYPFAWSNDPARRTAAAAGGCVLLSHRALVRIGGLASIADRLIDDCALAAAVKGSGGRTWIGMTDRTVSLRSYESLAPLWRMVVRTAFTQLGYSYPLAFGAFAGMLLLYVVPVVALARGLVVSADRALVASGGAATLLMAVAYVPTLRAYGQHPLSAAALPVAASFYAAMTLDSARRHLLRRGGAWKGRTYVPGDSEHATLDRPAAESAA